MACGARNRLARAASDDQVLAFFDATGRHVRNPSGVRVAIGLGSLGIQWHFENPVTDRLHPRRTFHRDVKASRIADLGHSVGLNHLDPGRHLKRGKVFGGGQCFFVGDARRVPGHGSRVRLRGIPLFFGRRS